MAGRLSSPRFRRRLLRAGLLAGTAAAAAVVAILFWNTGRSFDSPLSDEPAVVPPEREQVAIPAGERRLAIRTAARFVETAVRRSRTGESFDLVSPALRAGFTRAEWAAGNIPVQPYPVDAARWKIDYQYADEIGLQVYVVPERGSELRPTIFLVTMTKGVGGRWLVDAWVPRASAGPVTAQPAPQAGPGGIATVAPPAATEGELSRVWLLAPAALLLGVVLVPLSLLVLERRRNRRAERAYAAASAERSSSSSRPS